MRGDSTNEGRVVGGDRQIKAGCGGDKTDKGWWGETEPKKKRVVWVEKKRFWKKNQKKKYGEKKAEKWGVVEKKGGVGIRSKKKGW